MTTPSTERKAGPLLGTGAQTTWPFTFKVFAATDVAVTIADSLGVETALVYGVDFNVTLNANQETSPGGTVTYPISGAALPVGKRLVIIGNLPYDQPLDLPSGGNFSPLALENQLDRTVMQIQQLRENVGRALQLPVTSTGALSVQLPQPSPNDLIGWDTSGNNLANYPLADLATALAYGNFRYDTFTGDGTTTQFTLSVDPATLGNLDVSIAGVVQVPVTDYTLVAGKLVFSSAPPLGAVILARYGEAIPSLPGSEQISFVQTGTGAATRTVEGKLRDSVNFKDFDAVGNGVTDDSTSINHAVAAHTYVKGTAGDYLYAAATTADPSRITLDPDAEIKGMKNQTTNIGARDKAGSFIGFMQNYNETRNDNIAQPITTGSFVRPPLSNAAQVPGVDVLAYWYNDFGLEAVRAAGGAIGSTQWYTWQWAHTVGGATTYDPDIHPLLGWYRGDDPVVLDWICYWLREAGVKGILQLSRGSLQDTTNWSTPTEENHWLYQLFNNAPNFKGLSYVPDIGSGGSLADNTALITNLQTNILPVYDNYHITNVGGKNYGTIWSFDLGTLRAGTYGGTTPFETMLAGWATFFKNRGLDGVCVLCRNGSFYTANSSTGKQNKARVANLGVQVFEVDYGVFTGVTPGADSYGTMVDNFYSGYQAVKYSRIPNIMTGRQSHGAYHPSGWVNTGTTPELFASAAQQAAQMAVANTTIPNIVTVYNVSEWGEGGPSLQPTVGNGFGYLDAIRKVNVPVTQKQAQSSLFFQQAEAKTGVASAGVAFDAFTVTCSDTSVTSVEVTLTAIDQTGYVASETLRVNLTLKRTSAPALSLIGSTVDFQTTVSSANYTMTPTITANIVNDTTATVRITLASGGAIGWANAEYTVRAVAMSTGPVTIS
jgi:hypothetical protein